MLHIEQIRGVIFDVDDTLLDNNPSGDSYGLHAHSRLAATHAVAARHHYPALARQTLADMLEAFHTSPTHSLYGAIWRQLQMAGIVAETAELDLTHPLLTEVAQAKDELHEMILRTHGREIADAGRFIRALAKRHIPLAVASTACRRDIDVFFEMTGINRFIKDENIVSREKFNHPKPHPEPFDMAFKTLHLPEAARPYVVAFEDDPRGLASAKAAGLFACAITTRYSRADLQKLPVASDYINDSYAGFAQAAGLSF